MNDLKYWPSRARVMAFSTLRASVLAAKLQRPRHLPMISVVSLYFYHAPQGKDKPLQRLVFLVLYHNDGLVNVPLPAKFPTRPQSFPNKRTTHQRKFLSDSFYSPRDIRIQGRMTRLKHRRIISLPPNEQIWWVYASNPQDRMYRDLDWVYFRPIRPFVGGNHTN